MSRLHQLLDSPHQLEGPDPCQLVRSETQHQLVGPNLSHQQPTTPTGGALQLWCRPNQETGGKEQGPLAPDPRETNLMFARCFREIKFGSNPNLRRCVWEGPLLPVTRTLNPSCFDLQQSNSTKCNSWQSRISISTNLFIEIASAILLFELGRSLRRNTWRLHGTASGRTSA